MISLAQLEKCLRKCRSGFRIYANPDSAYDIMPARIYLYDKELIAVPKKNIYGKNIYGRDGALMHRGYLSIAENHMADYIKPEKLLRLIKRAERGFAV